MTSATAAGSVRTELRVELTVGRRTAGRPFGRLVVDDRELAVRSAPTRWIPARSVSRDAVGEISVQKRIMIHLPAGPWRRVEVVSFDPASSFADVSVTLSARRHIVDVLRARGYSVTDQRA